MYSAEHTGRVLKRDRRQRRSRKTSQRGDRLDVGNNTRTAGRIETRNREHDWP
jgi:hypothetical protein